MVHKKNQKQRKRVDAYKENEEAHEKNIQETIKFGKSAEKKADSELFVFDKKGVVGQEGKKEYISREEKLLYTENTNVEKLSFEDPKNKTHDKSFDKHMNKCTKFMQKHGKALRDMKSKANNPTFNNKRKLNDIWSTDEQEVKEVKDKIQKLGDEKGYLAQELIAVKRAVLEPTSIKPAKPLAKNVQTVSIPEPGLSYNPDPEEHKDVVFMEKVKENKAKDELKYFERSRNPKTLDFDMSKVLNQKSQKELEELERKDKEFLESLVPHQHQETDRITRKEKNKKLRRVEYQNHIKLTREEKRIKGDLDKSDSIMNEIIKAEEQQKKIREMREQKKKDSKDLKTQKVGKFKFRDILEPVLQQKELPSSLLHLQNVKHNPLKERYMMLQKKNIIEASGQSGETKPGWTKVYTKNSWHNTTIL